VSLEGRRSLLPRRVGEDAVAEHGGWAELVPPRLIPIDDMDDLHPTGDEVVRDDPPVAPPPVPLGAHARRPAGPREADKLLQASSEILGEGVVGVVPEALAPPGPVGRRLPEALPPVAPEALPQPDVSDAFLCQGLRQALAVEVGAPLGGGPAPHIDQRLDASLPEERQELSERPRRVADRVYQAH